MPRSKPTPREREHARLLVRGTDDHYEDTDLYDFEYADRTEDVRFYRRLARERAGRGTILELGAGTGRITCPLAEDHARIVALDRKPAMLEALKRQAESLGVAQHIEVVAGDMLDLPLPDGSVSMVIAPFNGLMHLYSWAELLRCFREAHRVLEDDGVFAFDVELPDLEWLGWDPDERHAVTRFVHPRTGERLVYSTNHTYDVGTQICHVRIYYDDAPPPGKRFEPPTRPRKLVHLAHRQIFPEEIRALVANAGLRLESLTGDFLGLTLRRGIQSQVAVCVRTDG